MKRTTWLPLDSVQVLDRPDKHLKTPPSRKRKERISPSILASATKDNPLDMTEYSPYVSDSRRVALTIELTEEEKNSELVCIDITTGDVVTGRLSVQPMFQETVRELQQGLEALGAGLSKEKGSDMRRKSTECVKMILWLCSTEDSLQSIEASLDGQDIYALLTDECYLSDSPIDYYRGLLIREEMKRAQIFNKEHWRRSWIHSTLFMTFLCSQDETTDNLEVHYDEVKIIERRYLGNRTSTHREYYFSLMSN